MRRRGFTLVELLVVIAILVAVTVMVVSAINPSPASKMRDAGRIGQATILGARDRALHASAKRGFRLQLDPTNSWLATAFVYVQPIDLQTYPTSSVQLERLVDHSNNTIVGPEVIVVHGQPGNDWATLQSFFASPARIRIPASTGQWYTFTVATTGFYTLTTSQPYLILNSSFAEAGATAATNPVAFDYNSANSSCDIEIRNDLLPNHQPVYLPSGIVIDLSRSYPASLPTLAASPNSPVSPVFQDVMFSPRGTVTGANAALGPIHLFLRDVRDALAVPPVANAKNGLDPASPNLQGDQLILTIFPQTGNVQVFPVDTTDSDGDGLADDPFAYARRGQASGG